MKRECGGVADNRTTNRNGAFVSMKSGLTLCRSGMERERGMAESKTKNGWSEGSSFLCVISLGSRSQNFQLPRVHAFCFACFVLPFFTLFAQLQIEIPLLSRGRIKRRTIRCNGHRFRIIPRPVFVSHPRKIFSVARYDPPHFRGYTIFFFLFRASARPIERKSSRALCSLLSLSLE